MHDNKKVKKKIGIVIPVANEEETIEKFCKALLSEINKLNAIILFVIDKASTDKTYHILQKLQKRSNKVLVKYHPENKNVVEAYIKGFFDAIHLKCDFVIEMDSGFSHDPKELKYIVQNLEKGYDCVFSKRPLSSVDYDVPLLRRMYSLGGTILSNTLFGTHFSDMTSGFNGYQSTILKKLIKKPLLSVGHFWHSELRFRARKCNYVEIPIHYNFPSNRVNKKVLLNSFLTLFYIAARRDQ